MYARAKHWTPTFFYFYSRNVCTGQISDQLSKGLTPNSLQDKENNAMNSVASKACSTHPISVNGISQQHGHHGVNTGITLVFLQSAKHYLDVMFGIQWSMAWLHLGRKALSYGIFCWFLFFNVATCFSGCITLKFQKSFS